MRNKDIAANHPNIRPVLFHQRGIFRIYGHLKNEPKCFQNKAIFTPHIDTGDYVIVINAEKVKVTGKKLDQKVYYNHSDYVGGMKETTLKEMMAKHPERVIEHAVKGMLPKGPLGREMYTKLFVYAGPDHKHAAQKPEALTF